MAGAEDRRIALLSVHPRFAEAILSGRKKVELRRVAFAPEVEKVLLYATSPVKAIVGWFTVAGIERDSPTRLWNRYRAMAGLSRREFRRYFQGVAAGVAILVGDSGNLRRPMSLKEVHVDAAPRNFCYPRNGVVRYIRHPRGT